MKQDSFNHPSFQNIQNMDPEYWDLPDLIDDDIIPIQTPIYPQHYVGIVEGSQYDPVINTNLMKTLAGDDRIYSREL